MLPALIATLLAAPAAARDCGGADGDISGHAEAVAGAFGGMDPLALQESLSAAEAAVMCLDALISVADAAAYHRARGVSAFSQADTDVARQEFTVARRLEPDWRFPAGLVPSGHPLLYLYDEAAGVESAGELHVTHPEGGVVAIDGIRGANWFPALPGILQSFDAAGQLEEVHYLPAGGERPARYVPRSETAHPWVLAGVSAGAGLLSGALYYGASRSAAIFDDPTTDPSRLDGLRGRTNALAYASIGMGAASLGLGVYTVISW